MTLWQDPPPQTRRQAREHERAASLQEENAVKSRRVGTLEPTPAGQIPVVDNKNTVGPSAQTADEPAEPVEPAAETPSPKPAVATPLAPAAESALTPPAAAEDRPMTRRELRALRQAQSEAAGGSVQAERAQTPAEPTVIEAPAPARPATAEARTGEPTLAPAAAPVSAQSFADVLTGRTDPRSADASKSTPAVAPYQPPAGHWSTAPSDAEQAGAEQNAPGYHRSVVSSGSVTSSNALILPTVPSIADATGPLTSTGEILVTGSIDLPRSLGATGYGSSRFDSSDIDRLFDQSEAEQSGPEVTPIRASRAVSTHTSTRDTITPRRLRGNKLPMALAITAAVLAIGVVGLLIAGYVFQVF